MAALTNYHKPGSLKPHTLFLLSSGGQKSEIDLTGLESRHQRGRAPSRGFVGVGEEPAPCLCRLLVAASVPWLVAALHQALPLV